MAFIDQFNLARQAPFQARVEIALLVAAINVMAELVTTPNHTNRVAYAHTVLHNPDREAVNAAVAICAPGVVTAASTDADIQFTINAQWDAYSN